MAERKPPILIFSHLFPPDLGGIQEYIYSRCLQNPGELVVLTSDLGGSQDFDIQQAFPIHRWPQTLSRLRMFYVPLLAFSYSLRLWFKYRYRFVECASGYLSGVVFALSFILPIQYSIYLHGNDVLRLKAHWLYHWFFGLVFGRGRLIVCNSQYTESLFRQITALSVPTLVVNPTMRPARFTQTSVDIRTRHHLPEEAILLFTVCRLVERKGVDRIIEALPKLDAKVHYIVGGEGPYRPAWEQLAQRLDVADRVHFVGRIADDELSAYYQAADVFVMLSQHDEQQHSIEGFGIVYLEAGYFGKPVVAYAVGGVLDAIENGSNGLLLEPQDFPGLVDALTYLVEHPAERERMGACGRRRATRPQTFEALYALPSRA